MDEFLSDIQPFFYGKHLLYVDVGAHTGTTLKALKKAKFSILEARLFEPNPTSFAKLQVEAAEIDTRDRVKVHNVAVGAAEGKVHMRPADTMTKVVDAGLDEPGLFETDVTTLDVMATQFSRRHISILKVDVEGYEVEVLKGAAALLREEAIDVIYIEAGLDPGNPQQCYYRDIEDVLTPYGYRVFRFYEQKNEWVDDNPVLRRVNIAFMSRKFSAENPLRLSREIFDLRKKVDAQAEQIGQLTRELEEARGKLSKAETRRREVEAQLAAVPRQAEAPRPPAPVPAPEKAADKPRSPADAPPGAQSVRIAPRDTLPSDPAVELEAEGEAEFQARLRALLDGKRADPMTGAR